MKRLIAVLPVILLASGCTTRIIDSAASGHANASSQIQLGDSKAEVLAILEPLQQKMPSRARKAPERYLKDGKRVYIFFARSGRQPDDLTTDDEFTPYVFEDGKLIAVGWSTIGGPKTQGQATSDTYINVKQTVQ